MSDLSVYRTKRKSILSSLNALGASELPVASSSVARNSVLASVAAAGVSLLTCQSANADSIVVFNPNVGVGVAAGDVGNFKLDIASLEGSGFSVVLSAPSIWRWLVFRSVSSNSPFAHPRTQGAKLASRGAYGQKFSQIGAGTGSLPVFITKRSVNGSGFGSAFSQEYYAFSFIDTSSQTHYGWIYGTLTGGYSGMSYNLISWAYDQTPDEQIGMGYTGASTPEPSTAVLGAMAALILGAAGVRKRNKGLARLGNIC